MLAFVAIVLGYLALTTVSWWRALSEARRALPAAWALVERLDVDAALEREIRLRLSDADLYRQAQEDARDDPRLAIFMAFGATLAFAVKRPFFAATWALSKARRREIVCRLVPVAAIYEYEWNASKDAAMLSDLTNAGHELMHMLEAADRMRSR